MSDESTPQVPQPEPQAGQAPVPPVPGAYAPPPPPPPPPAPPAPAAPAPGAYAPPPPPPAPGAYTPPPPPGAYAPPPGAASGGYQQPPGYGTPAPGAYPPGYAPVGQIGQKNRVTAGVLAILLGSLGIHKFYMGYNGAGIVLFLVSVLSLGTLSWISAIIGLIEGILYLTKTDQEFYYTYEAAQKTWF